MEQVEGKTKTTNAERCKRYREANADVYKINDALRKKRARLLLKSDKTKYEAYKKKERERKQLAKIRKDIANRNEQNQHEETLGPSTSFTNTAIKSRSIKKAERSLPQSPRRKKEVIKSLASKFNVRVQLAQKAGRKKNSLSEEEIQWVIDFLNRADISYTTPGRRDNVYLGKVNKIKKFAQKHYFLWTI